MKRTALLAVFSCVLLAACESGPPELPYPVFVQVDELQDVFMASMPGIRAKQLAGDPQTRRSSNRVDLPPDWTGTSGGMPGRSLEIFVVSGTLLVADIELQAGGYAFLPAGSLGFNLNTPSGARILYFLNDIDNESIIRAPIILDAVVLDWKATGIDGIAVKELRKDPGSGAMTWLLRVEPGANQPWEISTAIREGYLLRGSYQHSECVGGEVHTWQYQSGGYFYRPAGAINGGPDASAATQSTWLLRETTRGEHGTVSDCIVIEPEEAEEPAEPEEPTY